jgi:four helix bundle protein
MAKSNNPRDFRDLKVWEKSHALVASVYRATANYPRSEAYGLTSQVRRSSVSIPSNIAEGCGRGGDTELARFCQIAMGSASELEYQLLLSRDLEYLSDEQHKALSSGVIEIKRMLTAFINWLQNH